ncbi:MAG: hypothetical protein U0744_16710 [Gemmataceae bacterium]
MRHLVFAAALSLDLIASASAQDIPLSKILIAKEGWSEVASKMPGVTYLDCGPKGIVDIYQGSLQRRLTREGKADAVPPGMGPPAIKRQDIVEPVFERRWHIDASTKTVHAKNGTKLQLKGLVDPSCIALWPDEGHLVVGERDGAYLWAVRIEADGSFGPGDRYYSLRIRSSEKLETTAMTLDANFLLYTCTSLGIQVFHPTGRLSGVLPAPATGRMSAIAIGGPNADTLFVACGDSVYARKIQGKAPYTLQQQAK